MGVENPSGNPQPEQAKLEEKKLEQPKTEPQLEKQSLTPEEEEQYKQWMEDHPETVVTPEDLRECGPEIAEFEEMITSFEEEHSLEELHAITDLTPEDAPKHPLREPARIALIPIVKKLSTLKEETNISPEKHDELKANYKRLSRAIGMINKGKVDHTR